MSRPRVVVIGSGPCGAAAARELVERGVDVTILDAGARPARGVIVRAADRTLFRWVDASTMRMDRHVSDDPRMMWHESLTLGGLSNHWTSAVPRFAPADFTDGAALGEEFRWPIGYQDLEPFYGPLEQVMRITAGGPLANVSTGRSEFAARLPKDWEALCARVGGEPRTMGAMPMAKGTPWMLRRRSTGFNSYHCMIEPLLDRPNLRLVRSMQAVRLHWSAATGKVTHVDARRGSGHSVEEIRADAFVVAAGAVNSTRLLLRSTSADFPTGLGNAHGVLGRYLHDHPAQWWPADLSQPMTVLSHPVYVPRGPYVEGSHLQGFGLTIGPAGGDRAAAVYGASRPAVGVMVFGMTLPRPESEIALTPEGRTDPNAPVHISMRYDDHVTAQMEAARRRFTDVMASGGVSATPRGPFEEPRPGVSVHFGGTARMHDDPRHGVVDAWNRVQGVPNVVVCDSSCFTTGPEKNPTLTAMAIASRAASRLADELLG